MTFPTSSPSLFALRGALWGRSVACSVSLISVQPCVNCCHVLFKRHRVLFTNVKSSIWSWKKATAVINCLRQKKPVKQPITFWKVGKIGSIRTHSLGTTLLLQNYISFVLSVMRHRKKERCTSQRRFGEPRWDFIAWNQQNKTTQLQRRSWNDAESERVQHKTLRHSKYAYGNHSRTNWLVLKWCLFSGISCEGRRGLMARARLWDEESGSRIWPGYGVLFFVRIFYSLSTAYLYSPVDIDQCRW